MISQKTSDFTHEFVKKVVSEQEQILKSLQKQYSYATIVKILIFSFCSKIKGLKNRLESIKIRIFENLQRGFP